MKKKNEEKKSLINPTHNYLPFPHPQHFIDYYRFFFQLLQAKEKRKLIKVFVSTIKVLLSL